eukprot:1086942-Rhodomonas_salina.1
MWAPMVLRGGASLEKATADRPRGAGVGLRGLRRGEGRTRGGGGKEEWRGAAFKAGSEQEGGYEEGQSAGGGGELRGE